MYAVEEPQPKRHEAATNASNSRHQRRRALSSNGLSISPRISGGPTSSAEGESDLAIDHHAFGVGDPNAVISPNRDFRISQWAEAAVTFTNRARQCAP